MDDSRDITALLRRSAAGDPAATTALLDAVYPHLKAIAANQLRSEARTPTLDTTDLLHDAFVRLVDQRSADWQNRRHFFAVAARLVRRCLLDHARRRGSGKRGGGAIRLQLEEWQGVSVSPTVDWLAVDEALRGLEQVDRLCVDVVEMRIFAGLETAEIARIEGVSESTVKRRWRFARAWLHDRLAAS